MEENETGGSPRVTLSQKAYDLKTSGYTLLIVGVIGAAAMILWIAGVIPIRMGVPMKYISMGVMTCLFVLFIISGVKALSGAKRIASDAVRENEKREEIINWFLGEYDKETLDSSFNPEIDENDLYFERTDLMKEKIMGRFMELDEALLSDIIERLYTKLYG
ncbi:MAG: hypothetical protein K6F86_05375 [Lachnospiraceae bacterium]|nr:hypothetical protein [Lachnospiraceae bacterium]